MKTKTSLHRLANENSPNAESGKIPLNNPVRFNRTGGSIKIEVTLSNNTVPGGSKAYDGCWNVGIYYLGGW